MTKAGRETIEIDGLRVDGFKSFADPVTIPFEPGVTGIVGPVGCGKSNLVEALQWVMGETSVKKLRGEESEHLIFAGNGSGRGPRSHAEVSLLVSDPHRVVPTDMSESGSLRIVRRIARGQGTSYKVNGRPSRLKDLQVLFKDNATGPSSTGMINQGKVSTLVTARPAERRFVLDEAAGISGSLIRRREVETRLANSRENLERADETTSSVASSVRALKRQAAQAASLREVETAIGISREALARDTLARASSEENAARRSHEENEKVVAEAILSERKAIENRDASVRRHDVAVRLASSTALEEDRLLVRLAEFERETARIRNHAEDLRKRLSDAKGDLSVLQRASIDDTTALASAAARSTTATSELRNARAELEALGPGLLQAREKLARLEAIARVASETHAAGEGARRAAEAAVAASRLMASRVEVRLNDLKKTTEAARTVLSSLRSPTSHDEETLELTSRLNEAVEMRKTLVEDLELARNDESSNTRSATETTATLQAARSEQAALSNVRSKSSVRADVSPAPGYELATAAALGRGLLSFESGSSQVRWEDASCPGPDMDMGAPTLASVVDAPSEMRHLLSATLIAEKDDFDEIASRLPAGGAVVDLSGRIRSWHGLMVQGADDEASIEMRRRNRLSEVTARIVVLEPLVATLKAAVDEARSKRIRAETAIVALDRQVSTAETRRSVLIRMRSEDEAVSIRAKANLDARLRELAETTTLFDEGVAALRSSEEERAAIEPATESARRLQEAKADVAIASQVEQEASRALTSATGVIASLETALTSLEREIAATRERMSATTPRIETMAARVASLEDQLTAAPPAPLDDQDVRTRAGEATERRKAADSELATAQTSRSDAEKAASAASVALARAIETRERIREAIVVATSALEMARESVADGVGVSLEQGRRQGIERELADLETKRGKIGAVNLLAEEDLKEQEKRLGDMERARRETMSAIRDLQGSLEEIDAEARTRLVGAFHSVERHFKELASRIFGGGEAHLRMIGEDPLDAGLEIYVSPPGKSIQAISLLSGGERTMASLALVFAAFQSNPAPICVLDEADAALEDWSADVFCDLVHSMAKDDATRFLVVTHKPLTMARMDRLFGVTMTEPGVSRVARMDVDEAVRLLDDDTSVV